MLRFISKLRKGSAEDEEALKPEDGLLSPQELQDAETCWIKESQTLNNRLINGNSRISVRLQIQKAL